MKGLLLSSATKIKEKDLIVTPAASKGFLTPEECNEIIKLRDTTSDENAVAGYPDVRATDRSSRIHWIYPDEKYKWILFE